MSFTMLPNIPEPSYTQSILGEIDSRYFPEAPGVYVLLNKYGVILYTGKSKNLRRRMATHNHKSHNEELRREIEKGNIGKIKVFCCHTELDAIVLERYFIQGNIYRGKYNASLTSEKKTEFPFDDEQERKFIEDKAKIKKKTFNRSTGKLNPKVREEILTLEKIELLRKAKLELDKKEKEIVLSLSGSEQIKRFWLFSVIRKVNNAINYEEACIIFEEECLRYFGYFVQETKFSILKLCNESGIDCELFKDNFLLRKAVKRYTDEHTEILITGILNIEVIFMPKKHNSKYTNFIYPLTDYFKKRLTKERREFKKLYVNAIKTKCQFENDGEEPF